MDFNASFAKVTSISEQGKINCGIAHFEALSTDSDDRVVDNPAKFVKADNYNRFAINLAE